jgi:hypothetical protein
MVKPHSTDDREEALGLPSAEDLVGEGPKLDHGDRPDDLHEQVQHRVEPRPGDAGGQQREGGDQQRRGPHQEEQDPHVSSPALGDPRVGQRRQRHGDRHAHVHQRQLLEVVPREEQRIAGGSSDDERRDDRQLIEEHQQRPVGLAAPDVQRSAKESIEPTAHAPWMVGGLGLWDKRYVSPQTIPSR